MSVGQGISLFPWRAQTWSGQQGLTTGDHGEHQFVRIVGGYIGGLGRELRTFPGWKCVINPADGGVNEDGYLTLVIDSERPVAAGESSTDALRTRIPFGSNVVDNTQLVWARKRHLHSFHMLRDKVVMVGESGLRIEPIMLGATIVKMTAWERAAGFAVIVISPDPGATANKPNQIQVGDVLWIDSVSGDANTTDALKLSLKAHYVTAVNAVNRKLTLGTTVGAASVSTSLDITIGRCRGNDSADFGTDGRGAYLENALNSLNDDDSLTAYWVEDEIDIDGTPVQRVYPSYVANRKRDYGDQSSTVAGSFSLVEGYRPNATGAWTGTEHFGIPRRRTKMLPYRTVPQVSGERLLLAAPGYGCMFQIPATVPTANSIISNPTLGAVANYNSTWACPRSLGIPKGIMLVPNELDGTGLVTVIAGTGGIAPNSTGAPVSTTMRVAIAYRDDATGEIGQLSETWLFTIDVPAGQSLGVRVAVMHPGYALCETMALSIMLFLSKVNEEALNHIATFQLNDGQTCYSGVPAYIPGSSASSVYGLTATGGGFACEFFSFYSLPAILGSTPSLYNPSVELPTERSMPRGASWVKVVRGVRISGGHIGDTGANLELQSGQATLVYGGAADSSNNPREMTITRAGERQNWLDEWDMVGSRTIPSAYFGLPIWSDRLYPFPMEVAKLEKVVNCHATGAIVGFSALGVSAELRHWQRWQLQENPHRWDAHRTVANKDAYLLLPRGQVQIGEAGYPGLQSGAGIQVVDANKDEETCAGGEFRGVALMMTQRHTYSLSWGQGPAGSLPVLESSEFGCIAPNAVVEHDTATFWVSGSGPCEFRGEVARTGFTLEQWFRGESARFLRDSKGMMRASWGFYDEGRGLVFVGMVENRTGLVTTPWEDGTVTWENATDQAKSRFPCDTVLVYSPVVGAWSEWHPPTGLEVLWIGALKCADGLHRVSFMAQDGRIYAIDDSFGEDNQEPLAVTATLAGRSSALLTVGNSIAAATSLGVTNGKRGGLGAFVRVGMDVCIYSPTTYELKHRTGVASINSSTELGLDDAGTWEIGDLVSIGGKTMTLETTFVNPKGTDQSSVIAVTLKGRLGSRINSGGASALAQPAWAKASVVRQAHQSGRHGGGADRKRESTFHGNPLGDFIGITAAENVDRSVRLHKGAADGSVFSVKIETFGPAQVCLHDILLEVS